MCDPVGCSVSATHKMDAALLEKLQADVEAAAACVLPLDENSNETTLADAIALVATKGDSNPPASFPHGLRCPPT